MKTLSRVLCISIQRDHSRPNPSPPRPLLENEDVWLVKNELLTTHPPFILYVPTPCHPVSAYTL